MRALNLSGGKNIYFFSLTKDFFVYLKKKCCRLHFAKKIKVKAEAQ